MTQILPPTREQAAVDTFIEVWTKGDLASDIAGSLTCSEADALATLLTANGNHDAATEWITQHSLTDEEGDDHFIEHDGEEVLDTASSASCQHFIDTGRYLTHVEKADFDSYQPIPYILNSL